MKQAWSWSRLQVFEQCPKKYYLQNVLKVPNMKFVENAATKRGKRIHKLFEDAALKMLRIKNKTATTIDGGYPEEIYKFIPMMNKMVRAASEVLVEETKAVDDDLHFVDYFAKNVWLRYGIDFGIKVSTKAILIDWKTGKNWGKTDQLKLFAYIAMAIIWPDVNEVRASYIFVDSGEVESTTYHREDLDAIADDFLERSQNIDLAFEHQEWPEIENRFCRNCDATADQCSVKRGL